MERRKQQLKQEGIDVDKIERFANKVMENMENTFTVKEAELVVSNLSYAIKKLKKHRTDTILNTIIQNH